MVLLVTQREEAPAKGEGGLDGSPDDLPPFEGRASLLGYYRSRPAVHDDFVHSRRLLEDGTGAGRLGVEEKGRRNTWRRCHAGHRLGHGPRGHGARAQRRGGGAASTIIACYASIARRRGLRPLPQARTGSPSHPARQMAAGTRMRPCAGVRGVRRTAAASGMFIWVRRSALQAAGKSASYPLRWCTRAMGPCARVEVASSCGTIALRDRLGRERRRDAFEPAVVKAGIPAGRAIPDRVPPCPYGASPIAALFQTAPLRRKRTSPCNSAQPARRTSTASWTSSPKAGALAELGIDQWQGGYPHREAIEIDRARGESYVVVDDEGHHQPATAMVGFSGEGDYDLIDRGSWLTATRSDDACYGVVHRVAVSASCKGRGAASLLLACAEELTRDRGCESVRIDTHPGNLPMRRLLEKSGYAECGVIWHRACRSARPSASPREAGVGGRAAAPLGFPASRASAERVAVEILSVAHLGGGFGSARYNAEHYVGEISRENQRSSCSWPLSSLSPAAWDGT